MKMNMPVPFPSACALLLVTALAGCADPGPAAAPQPEVVAVNAVSATARVERVDHAQRRLTLKLEDGRRVELEVSPEVRNFAQIRKGDRVDLSYQESVLVQVHRKGTATPDASAGGYVERAPAGGKPAGVAVRELNVVATITAIAADRSNVTLKGPRGRSIVVAVREPRRLEGVRVGDLVELSYTEGVALTVSPASPRSH